MQLCCCLQQANICRVCVGDISAEIKTEADSNDINDCSHDDTPNTGMFAVSLLAYFVYCICFDVSVLLLCSSA